MAALSFAQRPEKPQGQAAPARGSVRKRAQPSTYRSGLTQPIGWVSDSDARLVRQTIRSPGEPLAGGVRADMEARFGVDLGSVRIHCDAPASDSCGAVRARAYTAGNHIAVAGGLWSPETPAGRRLLAHELTHVIQQRRTPNEAIQGFSIGSHDDVAESEADRVANAVVSRQPVPEIVQPATGKNLQLSWLDFFGRRDDSKPPPSPGPSEPPKGPVCGPDVTKQVSDAVAQTKANFAGWKATEREAHCDALDSLSMGGTAWDIRELHNNEWILQYRPACATKGADPPCGSTVKVGDDCYYAGSPNYVIYGAMCKLCYDHYVAAKDDANKGRFEQKSMEGWITFYKSKAGNYGPSLAWAIAGYQGWPGGGTPPAGDRNNCEPVCPTAYVGGPFGVRWSAAASNE